MNGGKVMDRMKARVFLKECLAEISEQLMSAGVVTLGSYRIDVLNWLCKAGE
jgi:hypothetical protein